MLVLVPSLHLALSLPSGSINLLRHHTRPAHDAIEALPCMQRLMAPDYSISEYGVLLQRLLGYLEPLESLLTTAPKAQFQLGCSRSECLRADLSEIGLKVMPNAQRASFSTLNFADESVRAGICYVFEGSSLGGQVIRRTLLRNLGAPVANAVNYFDCYHGNHGKVWRKTLNQIEQTPGLDPSKMVDAAAEIFGSLRVWLNVDGDSTHHGSPVSGSMQSQSRCPFARFSNWIGL